MIRALLLTLACALPALGQAQLTSDVHEPDLTQAWDMVFVAEGYEAGDEAEFLEDARDMARRLQTEKAAAPIREAYTFNYHFVFSPSQQPVSWRPGGDPGDTVIRSYVDHDGILVTQDELADTLAITVAPDVDSVVIVAKFLDEDALDPETFGELKAVVDHPDHVRANADMPYDGQRIRQPRQDPEAFVHELGHALFGLGDEYGEYDGAIPDDVRWEIALTPNLTTDASGARWAAVTSKVYEGGGYYAEGVYRPAKNCRMRASRSRPFCAVCRAAIRGMRELGVPATPSLTAAHREGQGVRVSWVDMPQSPLYYALELYRPGGDEPLWEDYLEGHLRSFVIPSALKGKLEVRLSAANALDTWSDVDTRRVGAVPATVDAAGFVDAVGP